MKSIFNKISAKLINKLKNCKMLVLDFDGVLTEGEVYLDSDGRETIRCDRRDGWGIDMIKKLSDVKILIITGEVNPIVKLRAKKLGVPIIFGLDVKRETKKDMLLIELKKYHIQPSQVCYVGDEYNDLECMQIVGMAVATANAFEQLKKLAHYITLNTGGHGAVREVCELILYAKGVHPFPLNNLFRK